MLRQTFTLFLITGLILIPLIVCASAQINNFHARAVNNSIVVEWSTESESGVSKFEIQRSLDKINWIKIGSVSSQSGNSSTHHDYQFIDNSIFKGNESSLNYRLVVIDQTGHSEIFSVIASVSGSSGIRQTWGSLKAMFR
jgi:hypothetical protein